MKNLDAIVAEDLLSRINPSTQPDRLRTAITTCVYGGKSAEQAIIKGLELLRQETNHEKVHNKH